MATVILELSACDEYRDFISVVRPHFLAHAIVSCGDGDRLIHQRASGFGSRTGEFVVEVCHQRIERGVIFRQTFACFLRFGDVVRREVMVIVESCHVEIDHSCDIKLEGLLNHVERNPALNLTWVCQESLFVDIGCEESILK